MALLSTCEARRPRLGDGAVIRAAEEQLRSGTGLVQVPALGVTEQRLPKRVLWHDETFEVDHFLRFVGLQGDAAVYALEGSDFELGLREAPNAAAFLRRPERRHGRCPRSYLAVRPADIRLIIRDLRAARPGDRVARTLQRQLGLNARPAPNEPHFLRFLLGRRGQRAVRELAARRGLEVRP